ncbi:4Fe-4S dicluster domain-containing protein [uncultured Adlercreutzia sp.]|uniref:4Fe-4S dicluster domain-containing protein n=1 Tax=uncultured Adlercreutzia sp. TaxID=875803 RepID=UPI0026F3B4FB|nr:4Fe-4S dicluster domain-containing protein [uncultured Adlercreutzia sp.]
MSSEVTRRQFCAAGGTAAVVAALGGTGAAARAAGGEVYLRPPGAASEAHLLARCDRCQRCVQACPYNLVQPRPLSWDFPTVGTPELIFREGYCDFCMLCVDVCPTGALSYEAPTTENIGVAKLISDACVAWDWGGCTVCADVCPVEDTVTLDEHGRPHVDEARCNGCGLCELECPAPSLRAYDPATLPKGIYVASRQSAAAAVPGALTSAEYEALHRKEAGHE